MQSRKSMASLLVVFTIMVMACFDSSESRYLPTRSAGDRVDKLRELLRELLESEIASEDTNDIPRWHPDSQLFYKREVREAKPEPTTKQQKLTDKN